MGIGGAILGGSLVSGIMGSKASSSAAKAQTQAAQAQVDLAREQFNTVRGDLSGYRDAGNLGNAALLYELGLGSAPVIGGAAPQIETITTPGTADTSAAAYLRYSQSQNEGTAPMSYAAWAAQQARGGSPSQQIMNGMFGGNSAIGGGSAGTTQYRVGDRTFATMEEAQKYANANPTGGTAFGGYEQTAGNKYLMDQGAASVNAMAAAGGGALSGRTLEALQTNRMGIAAQGYDQYLNRLTGLASSGQNAAGMTANASANYVNSASNALSNIGNAQAAGAIGQANAWTGAINNAIGGYGMYSALGRGGMTSGVTPGVGLW